MYSKRLLKIKNNHQLKLQFLQDNLVANLILVFLSFHFQVLQVHLYPKILESNNKQILYMVLNLKLDHEHICILLHSINKNLKPNNLLMGHNVNHSFGDFIY